MTPDNNLSTTLIAAASYGTNTLGRGIRSLLQHFSRVEISLLFDGLACDYVFFTDSGSSHEPIDGFFDILFPISYSQIRIQSSYSHSPNNLTK